MPESHSVSKNDKNANTKPAADGGHANSCRNWADCPKQEDKLIERQDLGFTKVGGSKKRPHDSDHAKSGTKKGCIQAPGIPSNSSRPRATPRPSKVQECQTTRQKQATFRARSAAGQADQCVYQEFCPDFTQEKYFRALEAKMEGLKIEDTTLRAFPLRKRAKRIVLGNVLFFVEDADLVTALRPYGQADARREAFITMRDGVKLSQIPARLDVEAKEVVTHIYATYGIKCTLCYKQGHKCANCPRKTAWTKSLSTSKAPPVAAALPAAAVVADPPPSDTAQMNFRVATLNTRGIAALRRRIQLCFFLKEHEIDVCFLQETNVISLDDAGDLCHGYSAVVAPATTPWDQASPAYSRQGLRYVDPRWPEHLRGVGQGLGIGFSRSPLGVMDQADLVDVATLFDATLEHTRVATIGIRVDARRLDRIFLPSGFCDRVTQYQTIDYAYSDHRAVLIQVGDPAPTRLHCIGKLLRIKAELVAEIRSLAPAVAESGDGYIERASHFLRRRLEDDTARTDYPSLPDLGRFLRARRRSPSTFTDDDGNAISGGQLRGFLLEDSGIHSQPLDGTDYPASLPRPLRNSSPKSFGKSSKLLDSAGPCLHVQGAARSSCPSYLFALLEKLGLPSAFLGWITVLYGEADASIRIGDVYTRTFPLLNGVRQGCRLSAALFSIGVGPLLRRLERILGRGSVVAYANDIVLFIRDDAQFELVPLIFEEFRMASGVAANFSKSFGLWRQQVPAAARSAGSRPLATDDCRDFSDGAPALVRSTRAALLDVQHLGTFCQRLLQENTSSRYHAEYEAETIVLRGSTTPNTRLNSQSARRALDAARLQAHPAAELAARWDPTIDLPRSISWADLCRNCFSGHDADVALRLALHTLPHSDHPASRRANCAACGSSDGSLTHRYWSCRAVRPLLREVFASCEMPLDLQAWLFGVRIHPEGMKITSVAKAIIYKNASEKFAFYKYKKWRDANQAAEKNEIYANLAVAASLCLPTTASSADGGRGLNWAEAMERQDPNNEPTPFIRVERKRQRTSASQRAPTAQSGTVAPAQRSTNATWGGFSTRGRHLAQEIKMTRKNIAEARAQQATGTMDHCVYVEHCLEFIDLATKALADRFIEEGLEIEDTLLKTYHFRKRAERFIVTNLPFFVEDAEVIAAPKPYGQVTSIAPLLVNVAGFAMKDGRRELFILLNEGLKLERLQTHLNINHKGEILPSFLLYRVKCSRCQRQRHCRANYPLTPKRPTDASEQAPSNTGAVKPGPASTTPTADPPAAAIPAQSPENAEGPCPLSPASSPPTAANSVEKSSPDQFQDPLQDQRDPINLTPFGKSIKTKSERKALLKQVPGSIFTDIEKLGLEREPVIETLQSVPGLKNLLPSMSNTQRIALNKLARNLVVRIIVSNTPLYKRLSDVRRQTWEPTMNLRIITLNARDLAARDRSLELCHFLAQHHVDIAFIQETNKESLDYAQDLCLGYSAIVAPPAASRGSGLACLFVQGVALLRHRVLWPGFIDLVHLDVHCQKMAVINCHLSHTPHERLEQLGIIAETAVRDNAWVVGDLNIDGGSTGGTDSASVEAIFNLLEQAALKDIATFSNLAHLPTRVADFGVQIHSSRLDRILFPAALVDRAKSYSTRFYRLSDHRARLPLNIYHLTSRTSGRPPRTDGELWSGWNRIEAEIVAEIRSLHTTSPEPEDNYVTRANRYIMARLEASSTEADYLSLPDLGRALCLRRVATIVRDEEGEIMGDRLLRSRALSFFRHGFGQDPADPAEVDNFIAETTTPIILEEVDPLRRSEISREKIAAAIRTLPTGKAPGCDSLPCELLSAYEYFFSALLWRVFGDSLVHGALPSSTRHGSICLVSKARSGPGLTGFRPITLPFTDYRVIAAILLRRLRPHLPTLAIDCQTYAIPGRSPSWNIARVTDEV
ncbi:hypothetical protein LAZ67_X002708 [Cordylochernes scorpioides]|uniref:Reverse transcriptase domain-containing protein n=1 Tax=Cordylochernes scorpioides TaxID=51811 RepID=A0ABY6LTL2_9ARAC|nr:hypothetical protein LAZ67_X002708 [Cordylochernes scorpioides]